jgi:hypothetical protein
MCKIKRVKPNYWNIKINCNKQQDKRTAANAIRYRINQEIKFLYRKKQYLNQRLYNAHLKCAYHYNGMWRYVRNIIESELNHTMNILYKSVYE